MKKTLIALSIVAAAFCGQSQTTMPPFPVVSPITSSNVPTAVTVVYNYLLPNTNALQATRWTFFGCYTKASGLPASSKSNTGYSFGAVYYVNSMVGTQLRMQYLDTGTGGGANAILLPNGEITLSSVYKPIASLPLALRPIAEMGAASNLKGQMFSVAGLGSEVDFYSTTNAAATFQRLSAFYGKEQWQGVSVGKFTTTQYGVAANFNLEALQKKIATLLHLN